MRYRLLGKTGLRVSEIGFGAWAIGGPFEVAGVPLGWSNTSDDDSLAAIRRARDLGVNFFDTSDIYGLGRSESLLGIVLSRNREKSIISTKVGNVRTAAGEFRKDFSKKHIFYAIDGSLKRLRTDYVDLYQVHNPTISDLENEEVQEAMEQLQEWGKIRFWGVSVATPQDGLEVMRRGWGYTLQVLYNIINQQPAEQLLPMAKQKNFGIIARVPLASGLLSGKYTAETVFGTNDVRQNFLTPRRLVEAMEKIAEVKGIVSGRDPITRGSGAQVLPCRRRGIDRHPRRAQRAAGRAQRHRLRRAAPSRGRRETPRKTGKLQLLSQALDSGVRGEGELLVVSC